MINIAIVEPSDIIYEGLANVLLKSDTGFHFFRIHELAELSDLFYRENFQIVIVNPALVQNKTRGFRLLQKKHPGILWIALVYAFFESDLLNKFDDTILVTDSVEQILRKLSRTVPDTRDAIDENTHLSEREIEVLIELVNGNSNKEIADILHISVHTVISHRKNIIEKLGIKSLPGLTIYALSKKIISLDNLVK